MGSDGATTKEKRRKYDRCCTGVYEFVPLSYGQVGPAAMKFLDKVVQMTAGDGTISRRAFLKRHSMAHPVRRSSCQAFRSRRTSGGRQVWECGWMLCVQGAVAWIGLGMGYAGAA